MKKIDITNIRTVKALHIYLKYMLDLPAYYGGNLDALHDVLCERGETIELTGTPASAEMEAYLAKMKRMLEAQEI